ncbi:hypothetical protein GQ600_27398 [Phytophthora cactorum]|nr:hypothetical protein GQ600_27398 [Phytophthora cactorum]
MDCRDLLSYTDADVRGVYNAENPILEYGKSLIPNAGNGIFATQDLYKGDVVTWYAGEIDLAPADDAEYTIKLCDIYLNGIRVPEDREGLGSFINREDREEGLSKNCEFVRYRVGVIRFTLNL